MYTYEEIRLDISESLKRLMEDRLICREDIQKTICEAETTGEKFINTLTGHSLAFLRPDRVTYWVEYTKVGENYQIHTAYSHRMEMKRKGKP